MEPLLLTSVHSESSKPRNTDTNTHQHQQLKGLVLCVEGSLSLHKLIFFLCNFAMLYAMWELHSGIDKDEIESLLCLKSREQLYNCLHRDIGPHIEVAMPFPKS